MTMVAAVGAAVVMSVVAAGPPDYTDKTCTARWIAHTANYGVLATISLHLNGVPFGNVASFSDGTPLNSTGSHTSSQPSYSSAHDVLVACNNAPTEY